MNLHRNPNCFGKLLLVAVCLVSVVVVSRAQSPGSDEQSLQQEISRLQRMLELQQEIEKLETQGAQGAQNTQRTTGTQNLSWQKNQPQTQNAPGTQKPQGTQGGAVTFHPEDTGKSVVTFSLGTPAKVYDHVAIKTNLLYGVGTLTPNLAADFGIGRKTTIGLSVGYNGWSNLWDDFDTGPTWDPSNLYKRRLDHVYGKVEFRYWLSERFGRHFVGANVFYADYRIGEVGLPPVFEHRYDHDGNMYGGGALYGYFWRWTPRWGMEFTLGLGVAVLEYDKRHIEIGENGLGLTEPGRFRKTYIGPTNVGVNIVFTL